MSRRLTLGGGIGFESLFGTSSVSFQPEARVVLNPENVRANIYVKGEGTVNFFGSDLGGAREIGFGLGAGVFVPVGPAADLQAEIGYTRLSLSDRFSRDIGRDLDPVGTFSLEARPVAHFRRAAGAVPSEPRARGQWLLGASGLSVAYTPSGGGGRVLEGARGARVFTAGLQAGGFTCSPIAWLWVWD